MRKQQIGLAGWGNYPVGKAYVSRPEQYSHFPPLNQGSLIARGFGRSYGDATLNTDHDVLLMERMNRFLSFDEKRGRVRAEAGVSFEEILELFVPKGWFLPVTPGTKYVTLGGAIAADVHGKNHHVDGTLGDHVLDMEVLLADGSKKRCSPKKNKELFWATVGGMGLTGIITEATLQLLTIETAYMMVQHTPTVNLDETLDILDQTTDKYSVAWIDCLSTGKNFGRSVVMNGRHATKEQISAKEKENPLIIKPRSQHSLPFKLPSFALNSLTVKAFNAMYYSHQGNKTAPFVVDYDHYFYPLDAFRHWNRLYGKRGFVQYQFVVPLEQSREALKTLLGELTLSKRASFLAVLKRFGPEGKGMLSFPKEGYTLALDIPVSDPELFPFLDHLDYLVLKHEGRVYLAKDARLKPKTFRQMYPRFSEWQKVKGAIDPDNRFSSDLSRRLQMEGTE